MAAIQAVTGVKQVIANMTAAQKLVSKRTERGLKRAGLFVLRESKILCPFRFGNLRGSAAIETVGSGANMDVIVHYGRDALYAVYVHENLDARHAPPTQAKYLEQPVRQKQKEIRLIIAAG